MVRKFVGVMLVISSMIVVSPVVSQVSAARPKSVTCERPNWKAPGTVDPKTGLNDAQKLAISCARKIREVTTMDGACVCFSAMLMNLIGDGQFRGNQTWLNGPVIPKKPGWTLPGWNAWPRWEAINRRGEIKQKWSLVRGKMASGNDVRLPYAIYWDVPSNSPSGHMKNPGHVAIYIGTVGTNPSTAKRIFLDNESSKKSPFYMEVGGVFPQNGVWPKGASLNFFHNGSEAPSHCRKP